MYKIGIVDDEQHARETLKTMLGVIHPEIQIVFEAATPAKAIDNLEKNEIDVLFLDIHLNGGTGFHVLERIPVRNFQVVFVTAYNQYAVDAFRFAALHYIVKPVSLSDLSECVRRIEQTVENRISSEQLNAIKTIASDGEVKFNKLGIPYGNEIIFIELEEIIRLESSSNYTWFILEKKKYLVSKTMKEYEDILCRNGFIRVHQSHIINPAFMKKYQKAGGGEILMSDEVVIPIARNRKNDFLKLIKLKGV